MRLKIINAFHSSFSSQLILSKNNAGALGLCHGEKNARGGIRRDGPILTGVHPSVLIYSVMTLRGQHKSIDLVTLRVLGSLLVIDLSLIVLLSSISHHHLLKSESLIRKVLRRLHFCWLWFPRLHFLILLLLLLYLHLGAGACRLLALELARGQFVFWKLFLLFLLFPMLYILLNLLNTPNLFLIE